MNKFNLWEKCLLWLIVIGGILSSVSFRIITTGGCEPVELHWDRNQPVRGIEYNPNFSSVTGYVSNSTSAVSTWDSYLPSAMRPWQVIGSTSLGVNGDNHSVFVVDNAYLEARSLLGQTLLYSSSGNNVVTEGDTRVVSYLATSGPGTFTALLHELGLTYVLTSRMFQMP